MIELMEKAFEKVSKLPDDIQNIIAKDLLKEIEWETKWDKTLEDTQNYIDELATNALNEFKKGDTENIGIDQL